jgi:hypothetical protein
MAEIGGGADQYLLDDLAGAVVGFVGLGTRRDGDRIVLIFRWHADPNTYELSLPPPWDEADDEAGPSWTNEDLIEELDTNYLMRAVKTRPGRVLRAEFDGAVSESRIEGRYWISGVTDHGAWLRSAGLDPTAGAAAGQQGRLVNWWHASVNSPDGQPAVAQIVVAYRRERREATIELLQLTDQATIDVAYQLIYTAIHQAARRGVHLIYSPATNPHTRAFEFAANSDPDQTVYDITTRDMNFPPTLLTDTHSSVT